MAARLSTITPGPLRPSIPTASLWAITSDWQHVRTASMAPGLQGRQPRIRPASRSGWPTSATIASLCKFPSPVSRHKKAPEPEPRRFLHRWEKLHESRHAHFVVPGVSRLQSLVHILDVFHTLRV